MPDPTWVMCPQCKNMVPARVLETHGGDTACAACWHELLAGWDRYNEELERIEHDSREAVES